MFRTNCKWSLGYWTMLNALAATLSISMVGHTNEPSLTSEKRIIGATATLTESGSGMTFPARIDTGAATCSLHVEKLEIPDRSAKRTHNVGKTARFMLRDAEGNTKWVEATIAAAVRVKSSSLGSGEFDHRYKVRLTLEWKGFRKEVLVTLNDRTNMEYPLLIGRNFLEGDFLVDVAQNEEKPNK
ncbi:MAG: ATP-dependent zinc protease [Pirellulales bacterium]|nr:ATP-dependent zinc protease [Pirellulales bacterium]